MSFVPVCLTRDKIINGVLEHGILGDVFYVCFCSSPILGIRPMDRAGVRLTLIKQKLLLLLIGLPCAYSC